MAKRKKTGGKDFSPGESGNPAGLPKGLVELRKFGAKQLAEKMNALMNCTQTELETISKDPDADMLSVALAKVMIKAADQGDVMRLNFIIERVAGPVTRKVELSGDVGTRHTHDLTGLSDEDLRQMQAILNKNKPLTKED
jgi:hypothetical protein